MLVSNNVGIQAGMDLFFLLHPVKSFFVVQFENGNKSMWRLCLLLYIVYTK